MTGRGTEVRWPGAARHHSHYARTAVRFDREFVKIWQTLIVTFWTNMLRFPMTLPRRAWRVERRESDETRGNWLVDPG